VSLVIPQRVVRGPVEAYFDTTPGIRIIDPNLQGVYGIQDALQLSGLTVAQAVVGQPVQVVFTATNIGSGTFAGLEGGAIENGCDTISGLITTADSSVVVAKLNSKQICVGPYGSAIPLYGYEAVSLQSVGTLPVEYAGEQIGGATLLAYVGSHTNFDAYQVGDVFAPNLDVMLQASVVATPQATPFPGSGGMGGAGGGTPPPSGGGGGTPPPSGGGAGGGGTPPPPGQTYTPPVSPGLTQTEKYVLAGAGLLAVAGVAAWFVSQG
jgi:hypothetical protein